MTDASPASLIQDKLYTLEIALDKRQMIDALAALLRGQTKSSLEILNVEIEVIRRRNQRCVIRYVTEAFDPELERRFQWRVIGKVYKANRGERVFATMKQLWENGFSAGAHDCISIPQPLAFSSSLCMLFQEEVPGLPMKTLLKQSADAGQFRQLARTLAKLHRCLPVNDEPFLVKDHLLRCHPSYPFLALACPELEAKINHVVQRAQEIEADLIKRAKLTPIHGDFHLGQVHLENGHAWLIDFDALSYGDPAADLGNLLVFLRTKVKKNPEVALLIDAFLDEYFSMMDPEIGSRIRLYEALTHVRRACKCLRFQEEGWRRKVSRMIEQAFLCVEDIGRNGHVGAVNSWQWQSAGDGREGDDEIDVQQLAEGGLRAAVEN